MRNLKSSSEQRMSCGWFDSLRVVGGIARIALAAHWPSDVAISYLREHLRAALLIHSI